MSVIIVCTVAPCVICHVTFDVVTIDVVTAVLCCGGGRWGKGEGVSGKLFMFRFHS